jgi:hypothetical protein
MMATKRNKAEDTSVIKDWLRWTEHELGGENRVRVWTPAEEEHGVFHVLSQVDFLTLKRFSEQFGWNMTYIE